MNLFTKLWNWLKGLTTRPGLQEFLATWLDFAVKEAMDLLKANNNASLKVWEQQFFDALKLKTKSLSDNWVSLLVHLAYEELKARKVV